MIFPTPAYGNTREYGKFPSANVKSLYVHRIFKSTHGRKAMLSNMIFTIIFDSAHTFGQLIRTYIIDIYQLRKVQLIHFKNI